MIKINPTQEAAQGVNPVNEPTNEMPNEPNAPAKKKVRRGLADVRGTTRLKFTEADAIPANHLFVGHLDSVELTWATQKEDSGLVSFAGLAVPSLVITFASNAEEINKRKYVSLRISPAESNALTIPGAKEAWKVEQPLNWLKHILNVYILKGTEMSDEMADKLDLGFVDFNEDGEYVQVEPEEVLAGWRGLFENFIAYMENNGKPVYKNAAGKILPVWMKLLRFTKQKGEWKPILGGNQAGDLAFPAFVGEGCIELYVQNTAPSIHVDPMKETIRPQQIKEAKAPTMPTMPGAMPGSGYAAAAVPTYDPMAAPANPPYMAEGTDDMPF